jgi:hypothetical protein
VPTIKACHFCKLILCEALLLSQLRDAIADLNLDVALQTIRLWTVLTKVVLFKRSSRLYTGGNMAAELPVTNPRSWYWPFSLGVVAIAVVIVAMAGRFDSGPSGGVGTTAAHQQNSAAQSSSSAREETRSDYKSNPARQYMRGLGLRLNQRTKL